MPFINGPQIQIGISFRRGIFHFRKKGRNQSTLLTLQYIGILSPQRTFLSILELKMSTTWNNLKINFCCSKSRLLFSTHSTDAWNHQKKKILTNIPSCTFLWTPAPTVRNYINYSPYRILDPHGIPQGKKKYFKKLKIILKPKICSELYSQP